MGPRVTLPTSTNTILVHIRGRQPALVAHPPPTHARTCKRMGAVKPSAAACVIVTNASPSTSCSRRAGSVASPCTTYCCGTTTSAAGGKSSQPQRLNAPAGRDVSATVCRDRVRCRVADASPCPSSCTPCAVQCCADIASSTATATTTPCMTRDQEGVSDGAVTEGRTGTVRELSLPRRCGFSKSCASRCQHSIVFQRINYKKVVTATCVHEPVTEFIHKNGGGCVLATEWAVENYRKQETPAQGHYWKRKHHDHRLPPYGLTELPDPPTELPAPPALTPFVDCSRTSSASTSLALGRRVGLALKHRTIKSYTQPNTTSSLLTAHVNV